MAEVQNRIVGIIGRKGSGKSSQLGGPLRYCPRLVVFDVMGEHAPVDGKNRFEKPAEFARFLKWLHGQDTFAGPSWTACW